MSLKDKRNFESAGNSVTDAVDTDGMIAYTVTIRATDPSGATGDKAVMVILMDVNESPEFQAPSKDQKTLYVDENVATGDTAPDFGDLYTHKTD